MQSTIIEAMADTREICSKIHQLRKKAGIKGTQPLASATVKLDAYPAYRDSPDRPELKKLILDETNIKELIEI